MEEFRLFLTQIHGEARRERSGLGKYADEKQLAIAHAVECHIEKIDQNMQEFIQRVETARSIKKQPLNTA